ncbi:regulatory protein GemA [Pseudoalteromonas sp. Hal040]
MNKAKVIQLIHIAKSQLGLDEDTYRGALLGSTGKTSCSDMTVQELNQALNHFKKSGFKPAFKRRLSPKSTPKQHGEVKKSALFGSRCISKALCVMVQRQP